MSRKISISLANKLLNKLWPDFKEVDGLILLPWMHPIPLDPSKGMDHTGVEAFCNHTHMIDIFTHHADRIPTSQEDDFFLDEEHPDFKLLCDTGKRIAHLWFIKLKQDFPQYRFRVYYTQNDNPIVRFHRVRQGEPFWLDEKDCQEEIINTSIIILDTIESLQ
jgi:hypothetical protein